MTEAVELKPSDVLDKAADLIEPEGRWVQGSFAETPDGEAVDGASSDATCWCLYGAIEHVAANRKQVESSAEAYLFKIVGAFRAAEFNDAPERTQADVVETLRKAAELARSEGQ